MKIAYIYTALTSVGGADRVITDKANYFADISGYEVYVITDSQAGRSPIFPLSKKVNHINLDVDFSKQYNHNLLLKIYYHFLLMKKYEKRLSKTLKKIKCDIVISTLGRDINFITTINDGSKKIAEAHTVKSNLRNLSVLRKNGGFNRLIAYIIEKKIEHKIKEFNALVVLNKEDIINWKDYKAAIVIPNSIPFKSGSKNFLNNKQAIFVGRAEWEKGPDIVIDVWNIIHKVHSDWKLKMFCNGTMIDLLKQKVIDYNLENSIYLMSPTQNIQKEYLESSICLLTSRYEGFGMVLIEAMNCGLPCVAFDCPFGPKNIIKNEEDGYLVENGNIIEMANKICKLIEDYDLRIKFGFKAQRNISRFSKEEIMKEWVQLFNSLIKK